tara:strand:- start:124 stop:999 length:876 start_codon:yes stop_codon:yes gene_type:complete
MKNILVTGSSGFIAKHLINKLISLGHNVVGLDIKNGEDLSDYSTLKQIKQPIDVVYHLAAQPYGRGGEEDPHLDLELNAKTSLNVFMYAKEKNISKVIYTSTMAVYGNSPNCLETDPPNPLSNYGVSKLFGEYSLKKHHYNSDLKYTIFRLWNTYGPGQDLQNKSKGLVQAMCRQACNSLDIRVTGSLERYRDLIYVSDVVNGLLLGLSSDTDNNTYNISTGIKITVKELIDTIVAVLDNGKQFTVTDVGGHDGDQLGCVGNSDKLQSIGWKPVVDLESGLRNFIGYIQDS